jgi:hypothetical protein
MPIQSDVMHVNALILEKIEAVHPPFPDELEIQWRACTEFMVAVGKCKESILLLHKHEPNPYSTPSGREKAFWATIFGSDLHGHDTKLREELESHYQKWLPVIRKTWEARDPRVTVLSSGLLQVAVFAAAASELVVHVGQGMQTNLLPQEWDERKVEFYQRPFNKLGLKWTTQPYDLRYRPFHLPNVVPDPFLESRPTKYYRPSDYLSNGHKSQSKNAEWRDEVEAIDRVFIFYPEACISSGSYTAALGRSFFTTDKGYMGLAPPDAQIGDYVAILEGTEVPFLLRKVKIEDQYRLVGEVFLETVVNETIIDERLKELVFTRIKIV